MCIRDSHYTETTMIQGNLKILMGTDENCLSMKVMSLIQEVLHHHILKQFLHMLCMVTCKIKTNLNTAKKNLIHKDFFLAKQNMLDWEMLKQDAKHDGDTMPLQTTLTQLECSYPTPSYSQLKITYLTDSWHFALLKSPFRTERFCKNQWTTFWGAVHVFFVTNCFLNC